MAYKQKQICHFDKQRAGKSKGRGEILYAMQDKRGGCKIHIKQTNKYVISTSSGQAKVRERGEILYAIQDKHGGCKII